MPRTAWRICATMALAGCGGEGSAPPISAPIVSTGHPVLGPALHSPIQPLPDVTGQAFGANPFATDPHSIHEGVYSDGLDLSYPPAYDFSSPANSCPAATPICVWREDATTVPNGSTPDFDTLLGQALDDGFTKELPKLDAGALTSLLDILAQLGANTNTVGPTERFVGWGPERGRWLKNLEFRIKKTPFLIRYSDPTLMSSLRERGARLYCAAREAQKHQTTATKSMGKQVGFSVNLFGQQVDFLTVEPTLVLDGPQPYLDPAAPRCPIESPNCTKPPDDGAQAFMVPMLLGTRITPVSFLPSLPEVRFPVALVTGDSEVVTHTHEGGGLSRSYQTITHADALLSTEGGGTAGVVLPLFTIGPVEVDFGLGLGVGVGQIFSNESTQCPVPQPPPTILLPTLPSNGAPANDRLLTGAPFGWPPNREGAVSTYNFGSYDEGKWSLGNYTSNIPGNDSFMSFPTSGVGTSAALPNWDPMLLRALEDDDRHVWHSSTLGLCAGISATLGVDLPPLIVQLTAGGSLGANVALRHDLRDGELAFSPNGAFGTPPAIGALSVTPSMRANASLTLSVHLKLAIDLVFGTVTIIDADLIHVGPISLASYDSGPWDEKYRFRLGTASSQGDPMKQPGVASHLPSDTPFASFPDTVDGCLKSKTPNVPPPPPCGSVPPPNGSGPPHVELCVYAGGPPPSPFGGGVSLPPNVCANIAGYVAVALPGASHEQQQCLSDQLAFLCKPVSQEQLFQAQEVVARIFNPKDSTEMGGFSSVVKECAAANLPANATQAQAQTYVQSLFQYGFCDIAATMLDPNHLVGAVGNPNQPPPVQPSSCM